MVMGIHQEILTPDNWKGENDIPEDNTVCATVCGLVSRWWGFKKHLLGETQLIAVNELM